MELEAFIPEADDIQLPAECHHAFTHSN